MAFSCLRSSQTILLFSLATILLGLPSNRVQAMPNSAVVKGSMSNFRLSPPGQRRMNALDWIRGGGSLHRKEKKEVREARSSDQKSKPGTTAGLLAVLGGFLVQVTLGSMYCWPSIVVYAPPHLQSNWVVSLTMVANIFWTPILTGVIVRLGPIRALTIGSQICAACVLVAAILVDAGCSFTTFMVWYVLLYTIGMTMTYTSTLPAGWAWFPNHRGAVSGFILGGFGVGSLPFNYLASYLANPKRLPPVGGQFPAEVQARFTYTMKILAVCYAVLAAIGSSLITFPPDHHRRKPKHDASKGRGVLSFLRKAARGQVVKKAVKAEVIESLHSRAFWTLLGMTFLHSSGTYTVAAVYRTYGQTTGVLKGDGIGALIGGLAAIANGFGRPVIGGFVDRWGVKLPWIGICTMQTAVLLCYESAAKSGSPLVFAAMTTLMFLSLGASWAIGSAACSRAFGSQIAPYVFGYVWNGWSMGTVVGPMLGEFFKWESVFLVTALTSVASAGLACTYEDRDRDMEMISGHEPSSLTSRVDRKKTLKERGKIFA